MNRLCPHFQQTSTCTNQILTEATTIEQHLIDTLYILEKSLFIESFLYFCICLFPFVAKIKGNWETGKLGNTRKQKQTFLQYVTDWQANKCCFLNRNRIELRCLDNNTIQTEFSMDRMFPNDPTYRKIQSTLKQCKLANTLDFVCQCIVQSLSFASKKTSAVTF